MKVSIVEIEIRNYNRMLSLVLSMIVTGSIMDNIGGQGKRVMVLLDICMGMAFFLWAGAFKLFMGQYCHEIFPETASFCKPKTTGGKDDNFRAAVSLLEVVDYLNYIFAGAILIILLVQVQNWYSKKAIAFVLAFFIWAQALGYLTWIHILYQANWIKYIIAGFLMLCFAVFDYFYWVYTPTQANIYISESTRSKEDRFKFDALQ